MKYLLLTVFALILNLVAMAIEKEKYRTVKSEGQFEIRHYSNLNMVSIVQKGDYDETKNGSFRAIASYIFGDNHERQKIKMTSPVSVELYNDSCKMSFMMPAKWSMDKLPKTDDKRLIFEQIRERKTASISFGGWASSKKIDQKIEELKDWLRREKIKHTDQVIFKGYDPPFKIYNRRNEVHIIIN